MSENLALSPIAVQRMALRAIGRLRGHHSLLGEEPENSVYIYWRIRGERAQRTLLGWGGKLFLRPVWCCEKCCHVLPIVQNSLRRQDEQDEDESGNRIIKEMVSRIRTISLRKEASQKRHDIITTMFQYQKGHLGECSHPHLLPQHCPKGRIIAPLGENCKEANLCSVEGRNLFH